MTIINPNRGSENLPAIYTFKYKIGDVFLDSSGNIIEITGYNYLGMTYTASVTMHISSATGKVNASIVYEGALNKMKKFDSMNDLMVMLKKDKGINYKIHYYDMDPNNYSVRSKVEYINITMTNIKALARMLNSIKKRKPLRRICMVSIVDENDKYITHVRFLEKEIKEQVFLTGMKERLLAYAKYSCGYEISSSF